MAVPFSSLPNTQFAIIVPLQFLKHSKSKQGLSICSENDQQNSNRQGGDFWLGKPNIAKTHDFHRFIFLVPTPPTAVLIHSIFDRCRDDKDIPEHFKVADAESQCHPIANTVLSKVRGGERIGPRDKSAGDGEEKWIYVPDGNTLDLIEIQDKADDNDHSQVEKQGKSELRPEGLSTRHHTSYRCLWAGAQAARAGNDDPAITDRIG